MKKSWGPGRELEKGLAVLHGRLKNSAYARLMYSLLKKILGSSQAWRLGKYKHKLELINKLDPPNRSLSDASLKELSHTIRNRAR